MLTKSYAGHYDWENFSRGFKIHQEGFMVTKSTKYWLIVAVIVISVGVLTADEMCDMTAGEVWNTVQNSGFLGGERGAGYFGYDWPGDSVNHNYYLWLSYFHIGAIVNSDTFVTSALYPEGEWWPDDTVRCGHGVSDWDVIMGWQDFASSNSRNAQGRHLGIRVITRVYSWASEHWNDIIAYEFGIVYDSSECDIPGHGEYLDSVYIGIEFDCDVSGIDTTDPHIDDLVSFDGWVNGEWPDYPYDSLTILPDTFLTMPDGFPDQYTVYGDDPYEHTLYGDTLLIPRNTSYMYDGDNPSTPGNDMGEGGASAGYIGLRLIYAPPTSSDSIWIDNYGDTARIPRVSTHQWFNWNNEPANDADIYAYMTGSYNGNHFAPSPAEVNDYKFLQSSGPHRLHHADTLWFVFVGGVGQGLNGGFDDYFGRGWIRGLRQTMDFALAGYYSGSVHSDPAHPSNPVDDVHWYGLSRISEKESGKTPVWKVATVQHYPFITLQIENVSDGSIEIYNIAGRKIESFEFNRDLNLTNSTLRIPLFGVPAGIYFVKLKGNDTVVLKKIMLLK